VREAANRTKCVNNMKQMGLALHNYHDVNRQLPPGQTNTYAGNIPGRYSFQVILFPFIEQDNVWRVFQSLIPPTGSTNSYDTYPNNETVIPSMYCPSDPNSPKTTTASPYRQGFHTNYVGNGGSGYFDAASSTGLFAPLSNTRIADITDGLTNTLMMGEILVTPDTTLHDHRGRIYNSWDGNDFFSTLYPPNTAVADSTLYCINVTAAPCTAGSTVNSYISLRSRHPGGVNTGLADGSVRFVSNNVNTTSYLQAGTRANGEVPGDF
jgi:prepilin-type processing-associated H-X9-DG protein